VPRCSSSWKRRGLRESLATRLSGSARFPKTRASAGQVWAQAGCTSPSATSRPSPFGGLLGAADALDAEGALLHDSAASHRHIRVQLVVQRFGPVVGVEVEDPHRVGAVVAAVAGPDAAVVDLPVQPVRVVVARVNRADRLAGRVLAMLAEHRQKAHPYLRVLPDKVALDAQPVHVATLGDLLLVAEADVIFRLAGDHAGAASGAAVQVDRHPPAVRARHLFHAVSPRTSKTSQTRSDRSDRADRSNSDQTDRSGPNQTPT